MRCMLSTFDNPYNPFNEFDKWLSYDNEKGYGSSQYLARIAKTSSQLTEEENNAEIERAINEILKYDFLNLYTKVVDNS